MTLRAEILRFAQDDNAKRVDDSGKRVDDSAKR
jgi:hypothetical protein